MAAEREPPTLADYAVTAISPVLIMLMVGSLVFFLVTVLPTGDYKERLLYTSFFFVIGAVLVARIAIQIDSGRAAMYGVGLAFVTFLAMTRFVEYPSRSWLGSFGWLVNLGLMGLIWWSAHRLTWDCTHIDEKKEASGRGVLAAAGLDADAGKSESGSERKDQPDPRSRDAERTADPDEPRGRKRKKKRKKQSSPLADWLERYRKYREQRKNRPHTPGVWVIYFALAALPLFALGQSLIDPSDDDRRRATLLQMAAYIASALGLLVTTALLGLRRYLRQRKARVPTAMTASWLGLGGILIVVFLLIGAFLPRPHSEVPWFGVARPGKSDRQASRYAQNRDSAGKGEGAAGDVRQKGEGNASGKNGEKGGSSGEKGDGGGKGEGKGGKGKNGKQGGKSDSGQKSEEGKDRDDKSSEDKSDDRSSGGPDNDRRDDAKGEGGSRDKSSGSSPKTGVAAAVEKIAGFLKWVVFAILAILVVIGIALAILRYLAPFTDWARNLLDALRNWWASLFGGKKPGRAREEAAVVEQLGPVRPPPFTVFGNPFEDGTAEGRDPAELLEYTFAAVDSWAWDRGHGRQPTETPREFAARLGEEFPALADELRRLANLYARMAYSTAPLPADTPAQLEQFWDQLVHGAVEPAVVAEV
jgi:hypothetical protein